MQKVILTIFWGLGPILSFAQSKVLLNADQATTQINKHIYGHFAEHLGRCIYDGIYVGDNNTNKQQVAIDIKGYKAGKVSGRILAADKVQEGNTFENATKVIPQTFNDASFSNNSLVVNMPANSVVVLELLK